MKQVEYIYLIRCPRDKCVIYVGKSMVPERRFRNHTGRNNSNAPISEYIRALKADGLMPTMEIICKVVYENISYHGPDPGQKKEIYWINRYAKDPNHRLLNVKCIY